MLRAGGSFPRGIGSSTVSSGVGDGGATAGSTRTTDVVDDPGSDTEGDSRSGDRGMMGDVIGIAGRDLGPNLDVGSISIKYMELKASDSPVLGP